MIRRSSPAAIIAAVMLAVCLQGLAHAQSRGIPGCGNSVFVTDESSKVVMLLLTAPQLSAPLVDYRKDLRPGMSDKWIRDNDMQGRAVKFNDSTYTQNCGGFVLNKLCESRGWIMGKYNFAASSILEIVERFGEEVSSVQKGDIILYGGLNAAGKMDEKTIMHVAYAIDTNVIEGKDNQGPYLRYYSGKESGTALGAWGGTKQIWRLKKPFKLSKAQPAPRRSPLKTRSHLL